MLQLNQVLVIVLLSAYLWGLIFEYGLTLWSFLL